MLELPGGSPASCAVKATSPPSLIQGPEFCSDSNVVCPGMGSPGATTVVMAPCLSALKTPSRLPRIPPNTRSPLLVKLVLNPVPEKVLPTGDRVTKGTTTADTFPEACE